jgi:hypothetical protein
MATKTQAYMRARARAQPRRLKDLITGIKIAGLFLPSKTKEKERERREDSSRTRAQLNYRALV